MGDILDCIRGGMGGYLNRAVFRHSRNDNRRHYTHSQSHPGGVVRAEKEKEFSEQLK